ncbi:class I SAM-dependent methyltransferase [Reyranella sp.]|uniref:methyltransferase domain-containing protein n=1 Tax=Reyranella sp. TaxID=1929291 RepID=UPI0025F30575|nr:class I SAM-dependent methyltransferase [Reyranella sp.]
MLDPNRPVGTESRKSYAEKLRSGFIDQYLSGGSILEVGFKGYYGDVVPIVQQAIGIDVDYPNYDGVRLPFNDESQDAVYSSHTLEHIEDSIGALREWFRVLKSGGYLVIAVPHQFLYEKKLKLPPRFNYDHKRYYTPASLLQEVEAAFEPNTYRIRHFKDNDTGYDYTRKQDEEPSGCFEIELVLQKIQGPTWFLGSTVYPAADFNTLLGRTNPIQIVTDFSVTDAYVIYGPYIHIPPGVYEACFHIKTEGLSEESLSSSLALEVAETAIAIASVELLGREGAKALRTEMIKVPFTSKSHTSFFEFRMLTRGRPFNGTMTFLGVTLRRLQ